MRMRSAKCDENADERSNRSRRHSSFYLCSSVFIGGSLLFGCSGYTGPRSVANEDAAVKIPQMKRAVERNDRSAIPQMVNDLDNNDSAVRFYASQALERMTGQHFDYDWTVADRHARAPAIAKWRSYLAEHPEASR